MKSFLTLFACLLTASADAAVTIVRSSITSTIIPDYNYSGYTDTVTVTAGTGDVPPLQEIYHITHVTVNLVFSDGWNGDLYVYLVHGDTMAMLLNRVGREDGVEDGSGSTGINITLDDNAPLDVHTLAPSSGPYAGTYASDGRLVDPDDVTGADPRTATLSDFIGSNPTGDWTLFVADVGFGNQSTLESWTLTVTAIPEPSTLVLFCGWVPVAVLRRRRRP